ncbi:hypothetical protein CI109_100641 [Kwoniella shandongensis]|uniref:Uncharacterized protein n=1 Tax=Kwoniella shandongensis TaxID=1734106 RepID=A0A5M6C4N9_9TREE|nr:uncharacterized protein CI109_003437 [Kwoniella shandongensis]KAA5528149.1 hypothetical protein CI109_003437 [Kwoniella shandongensis]
MSEICQDCNEPVPQPASEKTMAQSSNSSSSLSAPEPKSESTEDGAEGKVEFPAPVDPPSSATPKGTTAMTDGPSPDLPAPETNVIRPPEMRGVKPSIVIEFCDRCRWAPRATWIQTELFLTFPTPLIKSITLIPLTSPETGGRFRVWVDIGDNKGDQLAWDRKTEGGFPELKVLKQRIRNFVQPEMGLGHSDVHSEKGKEAKAE